jgi:hypothetical protein
MFYVKAVITHPSPLYPPFPKLVWEGGKKLENRNPQVVVPADSCFPIIFIQNYAGGKKIMGW